MRNSLKYPVIIVLAFLMNAGTQLIASDLSELIPWLRKTVSWKCTTIDKVVPLKIYFIGGKTGPDGSEVIVYVKNSAWDRIGQESDSSILRDYIQIKICMRYSKPFTDIKPNLC
jgi:hypothetical protein